MDHINPAFVNIQGVCSHNLAQPTSVLKLNYYPSVDPPSCHRAFLCFLRTDMIAHGGNVYTVAHLCSWGQLHNTSHLILSHSTYPQNKTDSGTTSLSSHLSWSFVWLLPAEQNADRVMSTGLVSSCPYISFNCLLTGVLSDKLYTLKVKQFWTKTANCWVSSAGLWPPGEQDLCIILFED